MTGVNRCDADVDLLGDSLARRALAGKLAYLRRFGARGRSPSLLLSGVLRGADPSRWRSSVTSRSN